MTLLMPARPFHQRPDAPVQALEQAMLALRSQRFDEAERLAAGDFERHVLDGLDFATAYLISHGQVLDLEDGLAWAGGGGRSHESVRSKLLAVVSWLTTASFSTLIAS